MEKLPPKQKKTKQLSKEELLKLDKDELVERIIQLEAHNFQLKNIISRNLSEDSKSQTKVQKKNFDFSNCYFRRVLLRILYFGWNYNGLAVQEGTTQTIEHHLFTALTKSCLIPSREASGYHRCGRTDKGVSSFGQVISISLRSKFSPDKQYTHEALDGELRYCKLLNRLLPKDISVVAWMPIPENKPGYSARFDCTKRQYKYYFPRAALNIQAMRSASARLLGSNDYRNLCKMDVGNGVVEFRRHILTADILPVDDTDTELPISMYYLLIEGNAFLWHQIRCIMAVLLLIGQGMETPDLITELLDVEKNPRKPQYNMALDLPLNLFHCSYDLTKETKWVYDKEDLRDMLGTLQKEWTLTSIRATMIKDVIDGLEAEYSSLCASEIADTGDKKKEGDRVIAYADGLIQGVRAKEYKPLLKRNTCTSLQEKLEYYMKRRKIAVSDEAIENNDNKNI